MAEALPKGTAIQFQAPGVTSTVFKMWCAHSLGEARQRDGMIELKILWTNGRCQSNIYIGCINVDSISEFGSVDGKKCS